MYKKMSIYVLKSLFINKMRNMSKMSIYDLFMFQGEYVVFHVRSNFPLKYFDWILMSKDLILRQVKTFRIKEIITLLSRLSFNAAELGTCCIFFL